MLKLALPLICLSALLASGCQSARVASPADRLTIMSYNVLYGFDKGKGLDAGARWIAKQRPDVLALQELNGFTPAKLAEAARRWGHEHAVILKEDGFPVGLTSRFPIEVIENHWKPARMSAPDEPRAPST